jgi:glycosyltransferase involved in cell wall biosynthesis
MNIALISAGTLVGKKEATWLTLLNLAKEYNKKGHHAVIIAKKHPKFPIYQKVDGIKIYRVFGSQGILKHFSRLMATFVTLQKIKKKEGITFNVIHGFSSAPLLSLELKIAQLATNKAKIVHSIKSYSKSKFGRKFFFFLHFANRITIPTKSIIETLFPTFPREKISVIRSNIDLKKFNPQNKKELKEKYGLSGKNVILYYGALRKQKGVDYLIQSIPIVRKINPNTKFIFLIRSSETPEVFKKYEDMINQLECGDIVELSYRDVIIEDYVSMADAVVLAYPNLIGTEGNPSCLLESLAAKTPVVTTSLKELKEIVTHEKDVLMATPGDITSLAENITRLLNDSVLQQKIQQNGIIKAKEFSTEKIANQFLELYQ